MEINPGSTKVTIPTFPISVTIVRGAPGGRPRANEGSVTSVILTPLSDKTLPVVSEKIAISFATEVAGPVTSPPPVTTGLQTPPVRKSKVPVDVLKTIIPSTAFNISRCAVVTLVIRSAASVDCSSRAALTGAPFARVNCGMESAICQ